MPMARFKFKQPTPRNRENNRQGRKRQLLVENPSPAWQDYQDGKVRAKREEEHQLNIFRAALSLEA